MQEKLPGRAPSATGETNQLPMASAAEQKKRKVTVMTEEHDANDLQTEVTSSTVIEPEDNLLSEEKITEFFEAAYDGSIERLDELFDETPHSDPNMTQFTESLLMAAIRAKQPKVAEYLIDALAINADHKVELLEFNTRAKIPIRERMISSRDLAYDEGMMNLVDLIDIASNEIRPSTKRYLQRRVQTTLDELHQAYLKRVQERKARSIRRAKEKTAEEIATTDANNAEMPASTPPVTPPPPIVQRSCKSYIEETLHSIQSANDKSIDETGKKFFRFSGYTIRYQIVDTAGPDKQKRAQTQSKKTRASFPTIPLTTPRLSPLSMTRSRMSTTTPNLTSRSLSEMTTQIPIRETRTSIGRSMLHQTSPDHYPDLRPAPRMRTNTPRHALPIRSSTITADFNYISQLPPTIYKQPRHFIPVTLKSTAVGLPSDKLWIRD